MLKREFRNPDQIRSEYLQIGEVYQEAFAGPPWNEVSKCVDRELPQRCTSGLSALAVGSYCDICTNCTIEPAYVPEDLADSWETIAGKRQALWYTETEDGKILLAALAWKADAQTIAREKYADAPDMAAWLDKMLGNKPVVWLDEVFANRKLRPKKNLNNYANMCIGLVAGLEDSVLAYRTKVPQMTGVARRDFCDRAQIFSVRKREVPDRRDFVVINTAL